MNKSYLFLLATVSTSMLMNNAVAGYYGPVTRSSTWSWVGTLSTGAAWQSGGKDQTFYLTQAIEKTYTADQGATALFDGEIFIGVHNDLNHPLKGELGVAVAATSDAKLAGMIWDDADPQFDNYTYSYTIQHTYLAVKGKLLYDDDYWVIPWVSGSLGVGFNTAHSFSNSPTIFEAIVNPNFASHTTTAFSYTVGAGVQKVLTTNWQIGLGYEFADWGKSELGRANGQTLNTGLSLSHLYTNGILFNITYVA